MGSEGQRPAALQQSLNFSLRHEVARLIAQFIGLCSWLKLVYLYTHMP